jgi:hypothetical protein
MPTKSRLEQLAAYEEQTQELLAIGAKRLRKVQAERRQLAARKHRERITLIGRLADEAGLIALPLTRLYDLFAALKPLVDDPAALDAFVHPDRPRARTAKPPRCETDVSVSTPAEVLTLTEGA